QPCRARHRGHLGVAYKVYSDSRGNAVRDRGSGGECSESPELGESEHDVQYGSIRNYLECAVCGKRRASADSDYVSVDVLAVDAVIDRAYSVNLGKTRGHRPRLQNQQTYTLVDFSGSSYKRVEIVKLVPVRLRAS